MLHHRFVTWPKSKHQADSTTEQDQHRSKSWRNTGDIHTKQAYICPHISALSAGRIGVAKGGGCKKFAIGRAMTSPPSRRAIEVRNGGCKRYRGFRHTNRPLSLQSVEQWPHHQAMASPSSNGLTIKQWPHHQAMASPSSNGLTTKHTSGRGAKRLILVPWEISRLSPYK